MFIIIAFFFTLEKLPIPTKGNKFVITGLKSLTMAKKEETGIHPSAGFSC